MAQLVQRRQHAVDQHRQGQVLHDDVGRARRVVVGRGSCSRGGGRLAALLAWYMHKVEM